MTNKITLYPGVYSGQYVVDINTQEKEDKGQFISG